LLHPPKSNLAAGDRAPNFVLPDAEGKFRMFYDEVTGRPLVLLFAGPFQPPVLPPALAAFEGAAGAFAAEDVDLFCVSLATPAVAKVVLKNLRLLFDPERKISEAFLGQAGLGGCRALQDGSVVAVLLDANQRILGVRSGRTGDLAREALAFYAARQPRPAKQMRRATAPVLIVPDLLDPIMCAGLIGLFETGKVEEGSVGSVLAGQELTRIHHERKKRLDHRIEDPEMNRTLQAVIGRRLAPELGKAFNFQGFRFDRFLVCRYAADREDRFRTHRDNVSPETADRRFAMTLNLNGDEYEGGELVFPEYGPDGYKPGNGGAVIFSCSLLHEALPVTRGMRFALLTFLRAPAPQARG
jgi:predicted 2-oxoglutarate/Fe(II)-dependent dioxygenase YbiX/peroxiredoxin